MRNDFRSGKVRSGPDALRSLKVVTAFVDILQTDYREQLFHHLAAGGGDGHGVYCCLDADTLELGTSIINLFQLSSVVLDDSPIHCGQPALHEIHGKGQED